jgi:hypothetical protein
MQRGIGESGEGGGRRRDAAAIVSLLQLLVPREQIDRKQTADRPPMSPATHRSRRAGALPPARRRG